MKTILSAFFAFLLLVILTACGGPAEQKVTAEAYLDNEFSLTRSRMSGRGDGSSDYQVAFFPPANAGGVEAYAVFYTVAEADDVAACLSGMSLEDIAALDKPTNRLYFIRDLSYADGVGNTLNTDQKDLVTGGDFTEAGTHTFYAASIGADGLLGLTAAPQTYFVPATAGELTFTCSGAAVKGSFTTPADDSMIARNYVFASTDGYAAVREQLTFADPDDLEALVAQGCALGFDAADTTDFTLDLASRKLLSGRSWDGSVPCYLYVASASADACLGVSTCDGHLITPAELPESSGTVGTGRGVIFPNGGAAAIGAGRDSILSASQAVFRDFPDTPRMAILGGSSGSESELWANFHLDKDGKKSFQSRFADAGFEAVYLPLTADNRDTIGEDPYFAALVASCHGVYFTGGDQSLGMASLTRSDGSFNAVGEAVLDLFRRGGVLAGTSAGAHMLGDVCFQDADSHDVLVHPQPAQAQPWAQPVLSGPEGSLYTGLPCSLDACGGSVVFDSHFGARGRLGRLSVMLGASDARYAVGLDEATGIAVSDGVGTVYGDGTATVLRREGAEFTADSGRFGVTGLRMDVLSPGDRFDFATGAVTPSQAKSPAQAAADPALTAPEDLLDGESVQTRTLLALAQSGETSLACPIPVGEDSFTATVEKGPDFAVFSGQRSYADGTLKDLRQTTVTGLLLTLE